MYERENEVKKRKQYVRIAKEILNILQERLHKRGHWETETCKCQKETELQETREKLVNPGKAEGTIKSCSTAY